MNRCVAKTLNIKRRVSPTMEPTVSATTQQFINVAKLVIASTLVPASVAPSMAFKAWMCRARAPLIPTALETKMTPLTMCTSAAVWRAL
jgi:hypothetical protein